MGLARFLLEGKSARFLWRRLNAPPYVSYPAMTRSDQHVKNIVSCDGNFSPRWCRIPRYITPRTHLERCVRNALILFPMIS